MILSRIILFILFIFLIYALLGGNNENKSIDDEPKENDAKLISVDQKVFQHPKNPVCSKISNRMDQSIFLEIY